MERFICGIGREFIPISTDQLGVLGIERLEQLHFDSVKLATTAVLAGKSGWVRLPFCNTLCAEGLGAHPELTLDGAKIREIPYQTLEELPEAFLPDFPRMHAMCDALDRLNGLGKQIIYQIEGPFTLLSYLLPMSRMFSILRKTQGQDMLRKAENWVCCYVDLVAKHGVKIFSFADPIAMVDILGKKVFAGIYRICCERILRRIKSEHPDVMIHLCGRLTQSLLDIEACRTERWEPESPCSTYGQALSAWCKQGQGNSMVGQYCLNLLETKRPFVTKILFDQEE